jgi:UPF0716 protein FxsA
MLWILLLLIGVPLIELFILIEVGSAIGALATIGLCVATAVLGTALLRQQGLRTLRRAQQSLDQRRLPALELLEGVVLVLGGIVLLFPGLVTDLFGFACLLPFSRRWLVRLMLSRLELRVVAMGGKPPEQRVDPDGRSPRPRIIDAEYRRRDAGEGD